MGGVKKGSICKRDGKHIICALTIESVESVCQTHRLNNPSTPVLCLNIRDHSECLRAVARYLPRKHWPRTWFHCSNSCKKATTANMGGRDIAAALQDTLKFVALLERFNGAIWTLENVADRQWERRPHQGAPPNAARGAPPHLQGSRTPRGSALVQRPRGGSV